MRTQLYNYFRRQRFTAILLALFPFLLLHEIAKAQTQAQQPIPVKLVIQSNAKSYRVGDKAEIEVAIQDANNKAVPAAKEYVIELEIRLRAGRVNKMQDTIKIGETSKKFPVTLDETGSIEIRARHQAKIPELREGSTFIKVNRPPLRLRPGAAMPGLDWRLAGSTVMAQIPMPRLPSGSPANGDSLDIKYSPQRTLLANGNDSATIHVFLYADNDEGVATKDIRVRLFNSGGRLEPAIVKIIKGEDYGEAKLVSEQVGPVTVEYLGATPVVKEPIPRKLEIKFGPAITQLKLEISPPKISLVDTADLIVQLLDEKGLPIATDVRRDISFAIKQGRGEIRKEDIFIEKDHFDSRTSFLPTWRGDILINAATPNLPPAEAKLTVTLPGLLLGLSGLGGLVGGVIAYLTRQGSKWWRIAIGLITGFVLYWAFIFGVITAIPRFIVLNPLSAFVLSTLGGWLGTEAFNQILKLLKLPSGGTQSSSETGS